MPTIEITLLGRFAVEVDGVEVADTHWKRRHAAALVKVLALAPGRRLHREQIVDLIWPDDTIDEAVPKLHKAAHYARRALDVPSSVVLRGETVVLCPDADVRVDVVRFEEVARRALADEDVVAAREALTLYGGELLPQDRYEEWAEERREHLRLRHLDLLRLAGRWEAVVEMDPSDELAHLELMRRHATNGDRHAALRQFERMDRTLRRELGVAPGKEALALRDRLLARARCGTPPRRCARRSGPRARSGRPHADRCGRGTSRTVIVSGPAGVGKTSLLATIRSRATAMGFRVGQGLSAPVEGSWPFAPVVEALADLCRHHPTLLDGLPDHHREEIDRALAGDEITWTGGSTHQRLFVAAAELVRLASASNGLLLTIDDVHDADDASLRLVHYLARASGGQRVGIVLGHRPAPLTDILVETRQSLLDRHGAVELELEPLERVDVEALVRRHVPEPSDDLLDRIIVLGRGIPFAVNELARRAANEPRWVQAFDANMIGGIAPVTREVLQRVAVVGASFDTDEFVALSGLPEDQAYDHLDRALEALIVEPTSAGYRFRHGLVRDALLDDVPPHRRRRIHRDAASRLIELAASAARIGHHLLHAGEATDAVPYLLRAAETDAAVGAYRDALTLVDAVRPHATGVGAGQRHCRCAATCSTPSVIRWRPPPIARRSTVPIPLHFADLRARLARSAVMSGDLETAQAALDGLQTDGGEDDTDILLARGSYAFFTSDFDMAREATEEAQKLCWRGSATGRCSTSSRCRACSLTSRGTGSIGCGSNCAGRGRTRRSPTPSSTAISARPSTSSTVRRHMPR